MNRFNLSSRAPRFPMNVTFLNRKISEFVAGKGCELSGAVVDPGSEKVDDPIIVNGSTASIPGHNSEVQLRDFRFMGPVNFCDSWGMLSLLETELTDFTFSGKCSQLFLGFKTRGHNISVTGSIAHGFYLCFSHLLGNVVLSDSSVRMIFLKKTIIEGDLDLSGLRDLRHITLTKMKVYGRIIVPSDPHLSFVYDELKHYHGDKVVKAKG